MNPFNPTLAALLTSALLVGYPAASRGEPVAKALPEYTVFVDPPTGFVFLKLPAGWKFVGKVPAPELARLPAGVVTALLTVDDDPAANRVAARPDK